MQPQLSEGQLTILVADDDPQIVGLLTRHLESKGYRVVPAADGEQALALARKELPDVVLLDVLMPGLSGWEVARHVRRDPMLQNTPIVFLTAIGHTLSEATSPLFADFHLDKPFEMPDLDATILKAIEKRKKGARR